MSKRDNEVREYSANAFGDDFLTSLLAKNMCGTKSVVPTALFYSSRKKSLSEVVPYGLLVISSELPV